MRRTLDAPTPVLTVTTRCTPAGVASALAQSAEALSETARRLGAVIVDTPLRVDHGDPEVVEVCLPIRELPSEDPPQPIAAEVLIPGTVVDAVVLP